MATPKVRGVPLISAVVIGLIIVIGVVCVLVNRHSGSDDSTPQAQTTPSLGTVAPQITTAPTILGNGPCGLPSSAFATPTTDRNGRRVEIPTDPAGAVCPVGAPLTQVFGPGGKSLTRPTGLVWEFLGDAALPYSNSDGPRTITAGIPSGFGHTPQGAITAGIQITWRGGVSPDVEFRVRNAEHGWSMTPAVREQALADIRSGPVYPANAPKGLFPVPEAVRVTNYAADFTHIEWAIRINGSLFSFPMDMAWVDGDWKVSMRQPPKEAAKEHPSSAISAIPASEGWTTWT